MGAEMSLTKMSGEQRARRTEGGFSCGQEARELEVDRFRGGEHVGQREMSELIGEVLWGWRERGLPPIRHLKDESCCLRSWCPQQGT